MAASQFIRNSFNFGKLLAYHRPDKEAKLKVVFFRGGGEIATLGLL
jgi:hypothetical protein